MNYFNLCISLLIFTLTSCNELKTQKTPDQIASTPTSVVIPETTLEKSILKYDNKRSLWLLDDQLYSGYAITYQQDSTLKEKIGFLNGRKEGLAQNWYAKGKLKLIANYHNGQLHGEKKRWSKESILLSHLNYQFGKPHGEQKTWYKTGELHKKLHLVNGKEEGIQKAFRKNGALYANYEAKEGRIFGLKKASLCFSLDDEEIQYED